MTSRVCPSSSSSCSRPQPHHSSRIVFPKPLRRRHMPQPGRSSHHPAIRSSCCHAVSNPGQLQQGLPDPAALKQLEYPLVERMFDHNWRSPLAGHDHPDPSCRPVLALGKFDALHKGHQALAAAALQLGGTPVLLSFSGMAAVLGWAPRKPLVAPCDRPRVLHLWAQQLAQQQLEQQQQQQRRRQRARANSPGGKQGSAGSSAAHQSSTSQVDSVMSVVQQQQQQQAVQVLPVRQRYIPFAAVRSLSPEVFVDHIRNDFKASGVVSGVNYRFGYRAAGDSTLLQQLCGSVGLPVSVVEMVGAATPGAVGPVSSTKIREMLDSCRLEAVKRAMGRPYRLVAEVNLLQWQQQELQEFSSSSSNGGVAAVLHPGWMFVPTHRLLNQHPAPGVFLCDLQLFVGATAHDDLLQLQQAVASCSSSSSSSSGIAESSSSRVQVLSVAGSGGCKWCIKAEQQQVEVVPDGLLVPQDIWGAAESCWTTAATSSSSGSLSTGSSSSSSSSSARGTDPLVWDTDDREDEDGEGGGAAGRGVFSALLVFDVQSCLMQMCTFP